MVLLRRKENLQDLVKYECCFCGKKGDPMLPWKFWFTSFPCTASLGVVLGKSQGACLCPQRGWSCLLHCSSACSQTLLRVWFHKEPNLNPARLMSVSTSCHSCTLPQRMRLGQCQLGECSCAASDNPLRPQCLSALVFPLQNNKFHFFQEVWINALTGYGAGSHCSTAGQLFIYWRVLDVGDCSLKLVLTEPGMLLGPP